MEQFNAVFGLLITLGKAIVAAGLPVIVANSGSVLLHHIAPKDFFTIPIFTTLSHAVGLILGILALYASFDSRHYSLEEIFLPSSPWNQSFGAFLNERANPVNVCLQAIAGVRQSGGLAGWAVVLLTGAVAISGAIAALAFMIWPRPPAWRTIAACAGAAALTAWSVAYLASLALWSLHMLNFWVFALVGLYYHYRTTRH